MTSKLSTMLLCIISAQSALCAEWEVQPYLLYTAELSDNRRLTIGETTETLGNLLTGGARLGVYTQTRRFYVEPAVVFRRYDKDSDLLDTDDSYLDLYFDNRSERSRFTFAGRYQRESTITSEFAGADDGNPDLDDPVEDDTGDARISTRRDRLYLRPQWSYDISNRTAIVFGGGYTNVDYDEEPGLTLSGYDSSALDLSLRFRTSAKTTIGTRLLASVFEADRTGNETDGTSLELTMRHNLSPQTTVNASAGAFRSEATFLQDGSPTEGSATDAIFRLGLTRNTELTDLTTSFRRTVSPSALGSLKVRNQLLFGIERRLSERNSLIFNVRAYTSRSGAEEDNSSDRDYARAELGFDRQLTRKLGFNLFYRYTAQERVAPGVNINDNAVLLSFGYRPQRLAMSR